MAFRVDIGSQLRPAKWLADGGARFDAVLTRAGIFTYWVDGKPFYEYRPESEVFDAESMASFEALPATDDHPAEPGGVTKDNRDALKQGRTGDTIKRDGLNMVGAIIVDAVGLVEKIKAGKVEVSCGYTCDLEMKPGTKDGVRYDAIQRNIRGNHVAIVDRGRAGNARVRVDGYQCEADPEARAAELSINARAQKVDNMDLQELLKKLGEVTEAGAKEKLRADTVTAQRDSAVAERDAARTERDTFKAERDTAKDAATKADADAKKLREDAATNTPALVKERVGIVTRGMVVLGPDAKIKCDDKDVDVVDAEPRAIQLAAILKVHKVDCSKESDAYVKARFDMAFEATDKGRSALDAARLATNPAPKVGADNKPIITGDGYSREQAARNKLIKENADAWQTRAEEE